MANPRAPRFSAEEIEEARRAVPDQAPGLRFTEDEIKEAKAAVPEGEPSLADQAGFALRSGLEGHTAGLSEPLIAHMKASAGQPALAGNPLAMSDSEVGDAMQSDAYQKAYAADVAQRKADKAANPGTDLAMQAAGALIPSPANIGSRITGAATQAAQGMKALQPGSQAMRDAVIAKIKQGGVSGLLSGLGYEGVRQASERPSGFIDHGNAAGDSTVAGGVGLALGALGPVASTLSPIGQFVAKKLPSPSRYAEKLAEKATGATGAQAANFREGTGRELLDRGIVKFGSTPAGIAKNAQRAMDAAEASKEGLLTNQFKDAKVDRNKIYEAIRKRIDELSRDESQLDTARKLESNLDDVLEVAERAGSEIPLAQSEEVRRGFDKRAHWESNSDAPTREAAKAMANTYREAGEEIANQLSPELGKLFKDNKTTQSLLIPVEEAASKRALQLQQSPTGGLLDMAAAGAGGTLGGGLGAMIGLALKSQRPRLASMGAVGLDQLGKFVAPLQAAAVRGPEALQTTVRILSKDPRFVQMLDELELGLARPAMAEQESR